MNKIEIYQKYVIPLLEYNNEKLNIKKNKFDKLVDFLKKNKISFIDLNNSISNRSNIELFSSSEFNTALETEFLVHKNWRQDFINIKNEWEKEKIDYIFFKSTGTFPFPSDNLDVLVKQEDTVEAGRILNDLGYSNLRNIQEEHKEFFKKFIGKKIFVPLHLHDRVCWIVPYEDNTHLWQNYKVNPDDDLIHYPAREDSLIIHTAHSFLENHEIKLKELIIIKMCVESGDLDWEYIFRTADNNHWIQSLYSAFIISNHLFNKLFNEDLFPKEFLRESIEYIEEKKWIKSKLDKTLGNKVNVPFKVPHLWTRIHSSLRELRDPTFGNFFSRLYQVSAFFVDRIIHVLFKFNNHPGFVVSFSSEGIQSNYSIIEDIQFSFKKSGISAKYISLNSKFLKSSTNFLKKRENIRKKKKAISDRSHKTILLNSDFFLKLYLLLDLIIFSVFELWLPKVAGKVILLDISNINRNLFCKIHLDKTRQKCFHQFILFFFYREVITKVHLSNSKVADVNVSDSENYQYTEYLIDFKKKMKDKSDYMFEVDTSNSEMISHKISKLLLDKYFKKFPQKFKNYKIISFKYIS